jgi:hypothetical protein
MASLQIAQADPAALDEVVARLVPAVSDVVRRLTGSPARAVRMGPSHARVSADLLFPDGVGRGTVVAGVFRYRGDLRVDLAIEHNRVFAGRGGEPSENRCYFNDYVASITLAPQADQLPVEFVRKVVSCRGGTHRGRTLPPPLGWFLAEITTARRCSSRSRRPCAAPPA